MTIEAAASGMKENVEPAVEAVSRMPLWNRRQVTRRKAVTLLLGGLDAGVLLSLAALMLWTRPGSKWRGRRHFCIGPRKQS